MESLAEDAKRTRIGIGRNVANFGCFDKAAQVAVGDGFFHRGNFGRIALEPTFHATIVEVANVTGDVIASSDLLHGVTEADALNPSAVESLVSNHGRDLVVREGFRRAQRDRLLPVFEPEKVSRID